MGILSQGNSSKSETGSTQNQNSSGTQGPSAFAMPYITQQFQGAQQTLNNNMAQGPYQGPLYTGINGGQTAAAQNTTNFGNGAGASLVNSGASGLSTLYGNANAYSNNAGNLAANGVGGPNANDMGVLNGYASGGMTPNLVSSPLSGALQTSGVQGAQSLANLQGNFGNIANTAMSNPTQQIAQNAGAYMNASPVQSAINSTNAQINQTLGINQAANNANEAAAGGLNSSRAGAEQALTAQSAALAQGSADSSILNNAYNTGLSQAGSQYQNGLNTALGATSAGASAGLNSALGTANLQNNMGQYTTSNQLAATNSALSNQMGFEGLNANTQLNANQQLGQGIFDAALGTNNVMGAATANNALMGASGDLAQQNANAQNQAGYQQFTNSSQYPWQQYLNFANLVDNAGGTQSTNQATSTMNSTTKNTQSTGTMQTVMNMAEMAAALAG